MKAGWQCGVCVWIVMGGMVLTLLPAVALAQWTHSGTATVEDMLGVGIQDPTRGIHLAGPNAVFRMDRDRYSSAFMLVRTAAGDFDTIWKSFSIGVSASGVNDGVFTISDKDTTAGGTGPARFTIDNDGQVEIGSEAEPQAGLHVRNPTGGHLLRLDSNSGSQVLTVQDDGDIYANGEDLELRLTEVTSGGYDLTRVSTLLGNTGEGDVDESFLALNGNTAILGSQGSGGLLSILDTDTYTTNYHFWNNGLDLNYDGDFWLYNDKQGESEELILATTGEEVQFMADTDNNTAQTVSFSWKNNGTTPSDKLMDLQATGALRIKSTLTQNHAFDLAEAYWKSESGIEAGDVVCIDPARPNAVVLAHTAGDPAVVGVVSTDPGIVMGGGAFSAEQLQDVWGKDIAGRFAKGREQIQAELARNNEYIQGRVAKVAEMKSRQAKAGHAADTARKAEELTREEQQLVEDMEAAALDAFCRENLAQVALAGRVPVKVDASYGAIAVGNLLVTSPTPGHAMAAGDPKPGTVIGKALEPFAAGRGTIMMLVFHR